MIEVRIWIALLALVAVTLLLIENGVDSSAAPLTAVCATLLFFTLLGCFNALLLAGWLYYAFAFLAAGYLVYRFALQKKPLPKLGYGFWFFVAASVAITVLLAVRQPMFTTWDEFSFWGTANKLSKQYNQFYTTAPVGWPWPATQTPALISFNYFVQFLGTGFSEWQTYAAYDIFLFAVFAAMLSPFKKKDWNIAFPVATTALLVPFVFTLYTGPQKVSAVYLDCLGDVPMGVLFGGVMACYYGASVKNWRSLLPVCLSLAALSITKDSMGLALAMVAAAIIFIDLLLVSDGQKLKQRAPRALGKFGICVGSTLASYLMWSKYLGAVLQIDRTNLGGKNNISLFQMPIQAVKDFLSPEKSELFTEITQGMPRLFLQSVITMLGTGAMVAVVVAGMVALAALLTNDKAHRWRCIWYGIFSTIGFALYTLFITLAYIYIFRDDQAFDSYERYMYAYYIGWFLAALVLLAISAQNSRGVVVGKMAVLAVCAVLCVQVWRYVPMAYSVVGFHSSEYERQRVFAENAAAIQQNLPQDGKTFIVSINDDGSRWFTYCYALLPSQVDYSFGGGDLIVKLKKSESDTGFYALTAEEQTAYNAGNTVAHMLNADEWQQYLLESECTTVFIDDANTAFAEKYGSLFIDGMDSYFAGETNLYTIQQQAGTVALLPMNPNG